MGRINGHHSNFLQKEIITFKNRYLRTTKQTITSLVLLILGFLVMAGVTWAVLWFIRPLLCGLPPQQAVLVTRPFAQVILLWLVVSVFSSMIYEARPKFYLSPELALLISAPIPAGILFIYRFIVVTCFSPFLLATLAIFILPPIVALGILSAAPWYYYLFIISVAYPLLIISASLGILLSMILVRMLSAKQISQAAIVFSLALSILWLGFFVLGPEKILPQLLDWARAAEPVLGILFPLTDAATTLTHLLQGQLAVALGPLLRLFLTSGVILVACILAAQKLYYQGYDKAQTGEAFTKKPVEQPVKEKPAIFQGRRSYFILTEWKKAARNHEMAQGAVVLMLMLFVYLFITEMFAPPESWKGLILLGHIAVVSFLASGAVAILFVPMAAVLEGTESLKEQYWLLKAAPLKRGEYMWSYWLALFLPQLFLAGAILLLINMFMGSSVLTILLSLAVIGVLIGSFGALKLGTDMVGYGGQGETATAFGGIVRQVLPFLYYIVALGILALGQAYTHIGFLSIIHHWAQGLVLAISGVVFLTLVGFTFYYSFRLGARYWEEMEI